MKIIFFTVVSFVFLYSNDFNVNNKTPNEIYYEAMNKLELSNQKLQLVA